MEVIILNDRQKEFLFEEDYVDSKTLDALTYKGWHNYFIKNFIWKLDIDLNRWRMRDLVLVNKETGEADYNTMLNFQGNDLEKLLKIL